MKKFTALCLCIGLSFAITGCTLTNTIQQYINTDGNSDEAAPTEHKSRVYMDEVSGKLADFNGSQLTLKSFDQTYTFDLTQATLECEDGMIKGDEISVIYEGQLTDTDTSTVKALKVVDEFHKKNHLEDRRAHGQVIALTPNTITIRNKKGSTATYPITGCQQYYQNGIKPDNWVYLHFKGNFSKDSASESVLNASHLKVLSISDIDPLEYPAPAPTISPEEDIRTEAEKEKELHAEIQNIAGNQLTVTLSGSDTSVNIDLSDIPVSLKGGAAPGSSVNITYTGELLDQKTLEGITVTAVTGEDPDAIPLRNASATVSGTIVGTTANTITILSTDQAFVTCFTKNVERDSSCDLSVGAAVRITFHPAQSRESNIYTALKAENI